MDARLRLLCRTGCLALSLAAAIGCTDRAADQRAADVAPAAPLLYRAEAAPQLQPPPVVAESAAGPRLLAARPRSQPPAVAPQAETDTIPVAATAALAAADRGDQRAAALDAARRSSARPAALKEHRLSPQSPAVDDPAGRTLPSRVPGVPAAGLVPASRFEAPPQPHRAPLADRPRTRELELVAQQVDEMTRRGFQLAGRRALFSARMEFIRALSTMAQALDVHYQTNLHSQALADGLCALKESDDFVPRGSQLEANLDIAARIAGHRTPAGRLAGGSELSALEARQTYYNYAQHRLAWSVHGELAGSMALHGLGKIHAALENDAHESIVAPLPKAMVFHQAALMANPDNALAANDLAVLLARFGRDAEARHLLRHSVGVAPMPESFRNLSIVHSRLGERRLAEAAMREAQRLAQLQGRARRGPETPLGNVQWVSPEDFVRNSTPQPVTSPPAKAAPSRPADPPAAERSAQQSSWSSWLPWSKSRR